MNNKMMIFATIGVFLVFLQSCQGHELDRRTDILHITEGQLEASLNKFDHLLLYFLDRRDTPCMQFLDKYLQLPGLLRKKGVNITVGVLELTPAFGAGSAFGIHHFPFVRIYVDGVDQTPYDTQIHEIHSENQIINMVEHALSQERHHVHQHIHDNHKLLYSNDPKKVEKYLSRFRGRILYCASGHEFHGYKFHQHMHPGAELMSRTIHNLKKLSRRLRHEDVGFAVLNVSHTNFSETKICKKADVIIIYNNIHGHDSVEVQPQAHYRHLYHLIKLKIDPHIIDADKTPSFHHNLRKSLKSLFILFYNRKHKDTYDVVLEELSIQKENFDKLSFVKATLDLSEGHSLAEALGVEVHELPCVVIVDKFKTHNMTKYKVHVPEKRLHSAAEKREFFEEVLINWHKRALKHHWKTERTTESRKKSKISYYVSDEFEAALKGSAHDFVMMFYYKPQSCRFCQATGEFLLRFQAFLAKEYNFSIVLGKSDLHKNEFLNIGYYNTKIMPAVFLYSKDRKHEPHDIGAFIRSFDIENVFYSFESHSNLPLDVTHIKTFRESVMDLKPQLLGLKSEEPKISLNSASPTAKEEPTVKEVALESTSLADSAPEKGHDEL